MSKHAIQRKSIIFLFLTTKTIANKRYKLLNIEIMEAVLPHFTQKLIYSI